MMARGYSSSRKGGKLQISLRAFRGPLLESPDNLWAHKVVVVCMQDRGFNSFAANMIKLSVNETKWSSLLARTCDLILYIKIIMI